MTFDIFFFFFTILALTHVPFQKSGYATDKTHCKTDRANIQEKSVAPLENYTKQNTSLTRYRFFNTTTLKNTVVILGIDLFLQYKISYDQYTLYAAVKQVAGHKWN